MQQRRIIWLALFVSTVIYFVVIYTFPTAKPSTSFDEAVRRPLVLPLYAVAVVLFVMGLVAFGRVKSVNAQAGMVLRLAVFEAAALMGLIAGILGNDWRLYLSTWALALVGFIREWPSAEG